MLERMGRGRGKMMEKRKLDEEEMNTLFFFNLLCWGSMKIKDSTRCTVRVHLLPLIRIRKLNMCVCVTGCGTFLFPCVRVCVCKCDFGLRKHEFVDRSFVASPLLSLSLFYTNFRLWQLCPERQMDCCMRLGLMSSFQLHKPCA